MVLAKTTCWHPIISAATMRWDPVWACSEDEFSRSKGVTNIPSSVLLLYLIYSYCYSDGIVIIHRSLL